MTTKKYVGLNAGQLEEVAGTVISTGVTEAGNIPALDGTGRLDVSVMPVGIGPDTQSMVSSENFSAGALVNVWDDGGVNKARKADCSNGRKCHGFVLSSSTSGDTVLVYFEGVNTAVSVAGAPGATMYLSTAGAASATPPSTAGYISQEIGTMASTTALNFEPQRTVKLA